MRSNHLSKFETTYLIRTRYFIHLFYVFRLFLAVCVAPRSLLLRPAPNFSNWGASINSIHCHKLVFVLGHDVQAMTTTRARERFAEAKVYAELVSTQARAREVKPQRLHFLYISLLHERLAEDKVDAVDRRTR